MHLTDSQYLNFYTQVLHKVIIYMQINKIKNKTKQSCLLIWTNFISIKSESFHIIILGEKLNSNEINSISYANPISLSLTYYNDTNAFIPRYSGNSICLCHLS